MENVEEDTKAKSALQAPRQETLETEPVANSEVEQTPLRANLPTE